jgi:hypothetical protein
VGPEKSSEKNTELMSVEATNQLLKRERRAWHNSSNSMTTKDMHFLLILCAHALSLGPLSFNERWDNPISDSVYHLPPACAVDWTQCQHTLCQHTFGAHFETVGWAGV